MKFILAALCLQLIARPCCARSVPFPHGINPVVGHQINVLETEVLTTCNEDDLYQTKRSALEDFKLLNKEIKDRIKEHGENCSIASPLTISGVSIRKRILCTSYRRPKVVKSVKGAFDGLLIRYSNSLRKCQNSGEEDEIFEADFHPVPKMPNEKTSDENDSNKSNQGAKFNDATETPMGNGSENSFKSATESILEAFTDLELTKNPGSRVAVGNSNGEVASAPNSSASTMESNEDPGVSIGVTDNQENPHSKSNRPLIINNISLIIAIFIALVVLAYVGYRLCGFLSRSPFEKPIPK